MRELTNILKEMGREPEPHTFSAVFIHSMVETIEFVLGTISNTASYLRLWALSLAHGQLSEVFMMLSFKLAFTFSSQYMTMAVSLALWPVFWTITFGAIICVDGLECFLHTLRLHWVEFNSKFFKGTGIKFKPYSFERVLKEVIG